MPTFEYWDEATLHKTMTFAVFIVPQTPALLWGQGYQLAHGFSCWHIHARKPTPVTRGRWSHQPHSQCHHQYVPTTHLWLHPLSVEQASRAREAHCLCTDWGGDSTTPNVKCKSVLVRQAFCFNKKVEFGSIKLWLYLVTTTATRSMTGKFFLK